MGTISVHILYISSVLLSVFNMDISKEMFGVKNKVELHNCHGKIFVWEPKGKLKSFTTS